VHYALRPPMHPRASKPAAAQLYVHAPEAGRRRATHAER
jgi:hypothetical protein